MKVLIATLSDNADHQDTMYGMYEHLQAEIDLHLLMIKTPKIQIEKSDRIWLIDCPKRPGICKKTFNLPLLFKTISRIKKENFDAIYFESLHVWNLPIMVFCGKKAHVYQVIHEVIPHEGDRQERMVDLMNKALCKCADTIVLRNKKYISEMCNRYHIQPERVKYLELWRRYPSFTASVHSKRVLFFGRINPYKGAGNLLEIVKMCPDVHFDVVGRVDPKMQSIVDELKKETNVSLNDGYVSDDEMRKAFINADWVIIPYNSASQSGIIIDAYKYSRPVVAYSVGAIAEQVKDGYSGYLIDQHDNVHFSEILRDAVDMPEDAYNEMCRQAYQYGAEKYSAAGAVSRFLKLIERENGK